MTTVPNKAPGAPRGTSYGRDQTDPAPGNRECWSLTQRIAVSEHFSKSELLPKFLLYICDRELQGMTQEITEQQIGVRVFNRPSDYNPGDDNIVRNYAGQLRRRLDLYFEREGADESLRISIPRGAYVPVFHRMDFAAEPVRPASADSSEKSALGRPGPAEQPSPTGAAIPGSPSGSAREREMFLLGAAVCGLLLGAALLLTRLLPRTLTGNSAAQRPLWSQMFTRDRDTFIVPADSGLGILQNLSERPASLADYLSGKYLSEVSTRGIDPANLEDLRTQKYSSLADINIVSKLGRLPEVIPDRFVIRFARDLRMDDLRDGNAILLGAIHTDPWVDLLQKQLNFQFVCESQVNHCSIHNLHPAPAERLLYENESQQQSHETFGVVALIPNLNRTGWILLIEGLNMAATQAAADTLLNDAIMRPLLERVRLPNGTIGPFEILIQTNSLDAAPLPSRVIATRFER